MHPGVDSHGMLPKSSEKQQISYIERYKFDDLSVEFELVSVQHAYIYSEI